MKLSKTQTDTLTRIVETFDSSDPEDRVDDGVHLGTVLGVRLDTLSSLYRMGLVEVTKVSAGTPFVRPTNQGRSVL